MSKTLATILSTWPGGSRPGHTLGLVNVQRVRLLCRFPSSSSVCVNPPLDASVVVPPPESLAENE